MIPRRPFLARSHRQEQPNRISFSPRKQKRVTMLLGAFSPKNLIDVTIGDLANSGQVTILVISPKKPKGDFDVLYRAGPSKMDEYVRSHPGITEALNGESGINYYQGSEGEHVVAFTPIHPIGWGLRD